MISIMDKISLNFSNSYSLEQNLKQNFSSHLLSLLWSFILKYRSISSLGNFTKLSLNKKKFLGTKLSIYSFQ